MKKVITVVLVLLTVLGGGGYLLAQEADASEPGDTLYTVDLLAEDIQRALTFDEVKRADLETEILTERVSEFESLSEKGKDIEEILGAVSEQQKRVQEHIGQLENGNASENAQQALEQVRNRYEQQLQQHIEVMEKVQNKGDDTAIQVKQQLIENLEECARGTCGSTTPSGNNQNDESGSERNNAPTDPGQQTGNEDSGANSEARGNSNN